MNLNANVMEENVIQINGGNQIKSNNNKCRCECKKVNVCEKDYVWNPSKCVCENGKHLASIIVDSTIICDEVLKSYNKEIKTIPTIFTGKKVTCKTQNFYIVIAFLLITTTLLIVVSMSCCLIKYKEKLLLPFHGTKN